MSPDISPFRDPEIYEIERAWMAIDDAMERMRAQAAWDAYRQSQEQAEREKRAMEWAIETGAKP